VSRHWAQMDELGFVFGMKLLFRLHGFFGRRVFRVVLAPVIAVYWLLAGGARRASLDYVRRLRERGVEPGRFASLRHFFAFGETILDKVLVWHGALHSDACRVENAKEIFRMMDDGEGGVIVTAHFGNIEASRALAEVYKHGRRLHVLVHTLNSVRFNQLMAELGPTSQLNLVRVDQFDTATMMWLAAQVEQGDFVVITGDRVPVSQNGAVIDVPFLGDTASFPVGPWILAAALKVPVFLMWAVPEGQGYCVSFDLFRKTVSLPRRSRTEALVPLVADFAQRLEAQVRRAPLQWFNFFDFWHRPQGEAPKQHV